MLKVIYNLIINIFIIIDLSDNIFKAFIDNDNKKISSLLKKLLFIYSKSLKQKKLYYFMKFYEISELLKYKLFKK